MNFKILSFIVMNRELARETTFQSSPNFVFLMKGALIVSVSPSNVLMQATVLSF